MNSTVILAITAIIAFILLRLQQGDHPKIPRFSTTKGRIIALIILFVLASAFAYSTVDGGGLDKKLSLLLSFQVILLSAVFFVYKLKKK